MPNPIEQSGSKPNSMIDGSMWALGGCMNHTKPLRCFSSSDASSPCSCGLGPELPCPGRVDDWMPKWPYSDSSLIVQLLLLALLINYQFLSDYGLVPWNVHAEVPKSRATKARWTVNGELPSNVGKNKAIEAHDLDQWMIGKLVISYQDIGI